MTVFNARKLRAAFERQAHNDELTQVLSRRGIFHQLKSLAETHIHYGIILLDIYYFKSVNDIYGHDVGDRYLKAFADKISEILPEDFLFGRIGGEEFLVIVPGDDDARIQQFVAACLVEIEQLSIDVKGVEVSRTCSIGVCMHSRLRPVNAGLKYADTALYQAKLGGRNRSAWYTTGN